MCFLNDSIGFIQVDQVVFLVLEVDIVLRRLSRLAWTNPVLLQGQFSVKLLEMCITFVIIVVGVGVGVRYDIRGYLPLHLLSLLLDVDILVWASLQVDKVAWLEELRFSLLGCYCIHHGLTVYFV